MGMSASQVRFLQLTDRKHCIGRELQHLSMERMSLTRDMQKVTKDYQAALCSKTMKWSNNSGVSYTDISYSTLMKPNSCNMKSPVLISNSAGKIVLNKKYQEYAQKIDEAGGKWGGDVRREVLSELTGIPAQSIDNEKAMQKEASDADKAYKTAINNYDSWLDKEDFVPMDKLAENLGTVNGHDLAELYKKGSNGNIDLKFVVNKDSATGKASFDCGDQLKTIAEGIKQNLSKYFINDDNLGVKDKSAFEEACDLFASTYSDLIRNNDPNKESYGLNGKQGTVPIYGEIIVGLTLNISEAFNFIMGAYKENGGSVKSQETNDKFKYPLRDPESPEWKSWYEGVTTRKEAVDNAKAEYDKSAQNLNQLFTAEQETLINYYDQLFQAVADNGWTADDQIDDSEYLNQMFQNNNYYITTMTENDCYNEKEPESIRNYKYEYNTDTAGNFDNIFTVNDSDARAEALVDYEYKKSIINAKESRIDTRMKNLETEQSSITKMLESINKVKEDNIESTFGIWS